MKICDHPGCFTVAEFSSVYCSEHDRSYQRFLSLKNKYSYLESKGLSGNKIDPMHPSYLELKGLKKNATDPMNPSYLELKGLTRASTDSMHPTYVSGWFSKK